MLKEVEYGKKDKELIGKGTRNQQRYKSSISSPYSQEPQHDKPHMQQAYSISTEYIAYSDGTREAVWLSRLEADMLDLLGTHKVPMACDNQGTIKFIKSGIPKAKTNHMNVKHLYRHNEDKKGNVDFHYIESRNNLADIMTKPLPLPLHQELTRKLGLY
jgi:hypothetical protein